MSAQQHIAISDPSFSPLNAEFVRMVDKGEKKQKEEQAKLKAVLQLVEKEVADAKSSASNKASGSSPAEGPSNTKFDDSMANMVLALQMLQVLIAKYGNDKARQHETISNAQLALAQHTLKDVEKQLKKMAAEKNRKFTLKDAEKLLEIGARILEKLALAGFNAITFHFQSALNNLKGVLKQAEEIPEYLPNSKLMKKIEKWTEVALALATMIVGTVLAQPELVVMGALMILGAVGAFKLATNETAKLLEMIPGVSHEEAQIIAAVLVTAVIVFACTMMGDVEEDAEVGANEATQVTEDVANAAEDARDAAADFASGFMDGLEGNSNEMLSEIKRGFKEIWEGYKSVMKALGSTGRLFLMSLMTALQNTQLVQKIYDAIATSEGVSKKKREEVERVIGYVMMAASFAVSLSMGIGAAAVGKAAKETAIAVKTAKLLKMGLMAGTTIGVLGMAGCQIGEGLITMKQGELQKNLMDDQATLTLLGTLMQMNSSETSEDQKFQASEEKDKKLDDQSAKELMAGIAAFANSAQNSPV